MMIFDKDKAYMEALYKCRQLIDAEYGDGGWLPPVRELSARLGVSLVTGVKVVKQLTNESLAESYARKGTYVISKRFRVKKIGVVLGNGEPSPFLTDPDILAGILDGLLLKGYVSHLIQGSPAAHVPRCALTHWVSGLIWLAPPKEAFPVLLEMQQAKLLPFIVINSRASQSPEDEFPETIPHIIKDYAVEKSKEVDFMLKRGHRRFGYVSSKYDADRTGLSAKLRAVGVPFDESYCTELSMMAIAKLGEMILGREITALLVEGNSRYVGEVFKTVAGLPKGKRPELVVKENNNMLSDFMREYPQVEVAAIMRNINLKRYADLAIDLLLRNLDAPENITSVKYDFSTLSPEERRLRVSEE